MGHGGGKTAFFDFIRDLVGVLNEIRSGHSERAVQVSFMQLATLIPRCLSETEEEHPCEP